MKKPAIRTSLTMSTTATGRAAEASPLSSFSHRRAADMAARQAAVSEAVHSEAEVAAAVFDFQSPPLIPTHTHHLIHKPLYIKIMNQKFRISTPLIVTGVIILCLFIGGFSSYNGLVGLDEETNTAWGNLQSQYQRRADLIPNLVNTVKGYAKHEQGTLESVVEARAKATQVTVDSDNLTPERMKEIQKAQGELSTALGKLLAISENYPDLKANENFSELHAQLEGTENRINESRQLYNKAVKDFNVKVRRFPSNIIAGICGFEKKSPFEADAKASEVPSVNF